jgi:hypothetical protein
MWMWLGLGGSATVLGLVNAVCGARRRRASKFRDMDTGLELSRVLGFQASSHGSSRLFSEISDRVGCDARPTVPGGREIRVAWGENGGLALCEDRAGDRVIESLPICKIFVTG